MLGRNGRRRLAAVGQLSETHPRGASHLRRSQGLVEDSSRVLSRVFRQSGDAVVLLGALGAELGGSEYLKVVHQEKDCA